VLLCKQEVRQHLYVCTSKAGKVRTCKRNQELHRYYLYFCTSKAAGRIEYLQYLQAPAGRPPRRCVEEQRMECSACSPCRRQLVPEILHEPDFCIFVQEVGGGSGGGGGELLAHKRCAGGSTSCYVQARYAVATSAYVSIRQHTSAYVSILSAYCQHTSAYVSDADLYDVIDVASDLSETPLVVQILHLHLPHLHVEKKKNCH